MSNFIVIEKDSLSKSTVNSANITLTEASIVHTKMHRDDVAEFIRDGNNLVLKLKNGEVVVIENFFVQHDEVASDLVFEEDNCALYWFDGVSSFKGIPGLEALLPAVEGSKLIGLLPWIVGGGLVAGGIIAATDDDDDKGDTTPPTVDVEYHPEDGNFTIDFSEKPYNPATGKPYTPEEIKDLITQDPSSNLDPDNTVVVVDPEDDTKFIVTPSPTDPSQDVIVKVPENSYEDGAGNKGSGDQETVDVVPPKVEVEYHPEDGNFTIDFSEKPYNPATGKPYTPDEIKDLITKDPNNNLDPENTVVTVDPEDETKFIVTPSPKDPSEDVIVKVPENSYTDEGKNPGLGGQDDADLAPVVDVEYHPEDGKFTIDFSEKPYNPTTGNPYTPEEIKDLITQDPLSNLDPNKTVVVVDPEDETKFIVTPSPKDPSQDVIVKVPENSYTDEGKNPGSEGQENADVVPPKAPNVIINDKNDGYTNPEDVVDGKVSAIVKPAEPVEVGDKITITYPGGLKEVIVDEANKDSINKDGIPVEFEKPEEGQEFTVDAIVTDKTGNTSKKGEDTSIVDTSIPEITIDSEIEEDDIINAKEAGDGVTISGQTKGVEEGQEVTVTINGSKTQSNCWHRWFMEC